MPTQLERDIEDRQRQVDLVKRTIAKVEAGQGTAKKQVLDGLRETLLVHENALSDLKKRRSGET